MSYVQRANNQFTLDGNRFRFIGFNHYQLLVSTQTQAQVQAFFDVCKAKGITVIRTWCFDSGYMPSNTAGNFRYLNFPLAFPNLITNYDFETNTAGYTLDANFARSNATAYSGSWSVKQTSVGGFQNFTTANDGVGIPVAINTDYTFHFFYNISVSGNGPIVHVYKTSPFGTELASGFPGDTGGQWVHGFIDFNSGSNTKVFIRINNNGGNVTGYWDYFNLSVKQPPELSWREDTFTHLDMVLDEARQRGVRLMLSLADNPTYNTKNTYIRWSDAIYGTDYFTPVSKSVSSLVRASNITTATTAAAHGYAVGTLVNIVGANETAFNANGTFVRSVPTPTTFTYSNTGANGSATGTLSTIRNSNYKTQNFYRDTNCKAMYKAFFNKLATRVNTINGRTYSADDTIFSWEMGNELRYDQDNDPGINGTGSHNLSVISGTNGIAPNSTQYATAWAKEMADYFKSIDTNHLVSFGSMAHTWQFTTGDTVSNGTYYGVDYNYLSNIPNIDYLDFHVYPDQADAVHLMKFGQRLGFPNQVTGEGFRAQLRDYVSVGKTNNKPIICSEVGFVRETIADNTYYPLYPRTSAFNDIFNTIFGADGDGVMLWNAEINDGGTYTVNISGTWNGNTTNLNYDDRPLMSLIQTLNSELYTLPNPPAPPDPPVPEYFPPLWRKGDTLPIVLMDDPDYIMNDTVSTMDQINLTPTLWTEADVI